MPRLGSLQTRFEKIDLKRRRLDPRLRLLLKRVQDVNATSEPNGIYRAKRVASMVGNDLQRSGTAEARKGFSVGMLVTLLRLVQRISDEPLNVVRKLEEVCFRPSNPNDW